MSDTSLVFNIIGKDKTSAAFSSASKHVSEFGKTAKFAALAAAGGVVAIGGSMIKNGIQTAAAMEQAQVGFTTLIGSADKAKTFIGNLQKFAAATPFELPGLVDSSRTLLGVGVASQDVIPMLTAFGDSAGAVGVGQEAFQRIMLATSQAISAGKFQTADLNQINTNGIPVWKILSEAMGKPVSTLRDMASKGKLLSSDVLPVLQKQMEKDYGGAMAKQSQTLSGVWSTLMDTMNIGMANALKPLIPILEKDLPGAANFLSGVIAGFGKVLAFVIPLVGHLASALTPMFKSAASAVGVFWNAFKGESSPGEFEGNMNKINRAGIKVGAWIRNDFLPAAKRFGAWFKTEAVPAIKAFAARLWQDLQPALKQIWASFQKDILPALRSLAQRFVEAWPTIKKVAEILGVLAEFILTKVVPVLIKLYGKYLANLIHVWGIVFSSVVKVIGIVIDVGAAIGRAGKKFWDFAGDVKSAIGGAKTWIVDKFTSVVDFVKGLPGKISRAASGMFDGIKNAFKSAINFIISGWNALHFTIGGGSHFGVSIPSFTLGTPQIPYLAKGGTITRDGLAVVGEAGPELVSLNRGASVMPLPPAGRGVGGGERELKVTFDFTSKGAENALVEAIRQAVRTRGGNVQTAFGR